MTELVCPEYRVRLFLSADLVGSTAFKAGAGSSRPDGEPHPIWVTETRKFYDQFPRTVAARYTDVLQVSRLEDCHQNGPKVWKTIGDEILFCTRLITIEHLACCVTAFMKAISEYGEALDARGLDLKGTGWIAAFPSPNVTLKVMNEAGSKFSDLPDEALEAQADHSPRDFDFLGKDIDAGFRVSRHSDADKLSLTADLALLLCEAHKNDHFSGRFSYSGRESLKGVMGGKPYPIVTLDTERRAEKRELRDLEKAVTGNGDVLPLHLGNFIRSLLRNEKIEVPHLRENATQEFPSHPPSYENFKEAWALQRDEVISRTSSEEASAAPAADVGSEELPEAIAESFYKALLDQLQKKMER